MKLPALYFTQSAIHHAFSTSVAQSDTARALPGIGLQNYYNVRLSGGDAGIGSCNNVFNALFATPGIDYVKNCDGYGGWGCYKRVKTTVGYGINNLRNRIDYIINNNGYNNLAGEVNTGLSCG